MRKAEYDLRAPAHVFVETITTLSLTNHAILVLCTFPLVDRILQPLENANFVLTSMTGSDPEIEVWRLFKAPCIMRVEENI